MERMKRWFRTSVQTGGYYETRARWAVSVLCIASARADANRALGLRDPADGLRPDDEGASLVPNR